MARAPVELARTPRSTKKCEVDFELDFRALRRSLRSSDKWHDGRMRCEEHGLAAGPGGECVVCLRDSRARAARRAHWLGAAFLGSVLFACSGLSATRLLRTRSVAESPLRVAADAAEPVASVPRELEPPSVQPVLTSTWPLDLPSTITSPVDEPVAAISAISSAPAALASVASAERAPGTRVPSKRELMAALHATPVSMFSASWCPHCQRARRFFQTYGLSVVDHDVDADAQAAAELKRRSGGMAVPLIDIDGLELKGFNEQATMEAVVASVERRLGITGVKLSAASVSN